MLPRTFRYIDHFFCRVLWVELKASKVCVFKVLIDTAKLSFNKVY